MTSRQNVPQNFNFGNQQNYVTDGNVELSPRPINERDISPFQNDSLEQNQNSPQRSVQPFGRDSRSPKYSPSHGQSPHHHSISPNRCHLQTVETREIFVHCLTCGYNSDACFVFVDYLELMLRYTAVVPTCLHFFESVTDLHSFQGQLELCQRFR
jgi:hypothetical protein